MQSLPLVQVAAVAAGASVGALLRWRAGLWLDGQWHGIPLATWAVNCVGGLAVGIALAWFGRHPDELLRLLLVTGLLGGLTTFSTFSAESLVLLQHGRFGSALAHSLVHVLGALGSAAAGFHLARRLID